MAAKKLGQLKAHNGADSIAGVASGRASQQSLKAFKDFIMGTLGSKFLDSLDGDEYRAVIKGIGAIQGKAGSTTSTRLEDIFDVDCILLAGADPFKSHPVAGSYIVRAVRQNKAKLIIIGTAKNTFPEYATLWLKSKKGQETAVINSLATSLNGGQVKYESAGINKKELIEAMDILARAKRSLVIYGEGVLQQRNAELISALYNLAAVSSNGSKTGIISLKSRGNSLGAWDIGIAHRSESVINSLVPNGVKALYLLLADDYVEANQLPWLPKGIDFLIVQSSYLSPLAQKADVILPSPTWTEVSGNYSTLDGKSISVSRITKPPEGVRADWETINDIAKRFK
jgi:formate dehydrogenase major subunit